MLVFSLSTQISLPRVFKMSAFVTYACLEWCTPLQWNNLFIYLFF